MTTPTTDLMTVGPFADILNGRGPAMTTPTVDPMTGHLTDAQATAFNLFRERLERRLPEFHITGVQPFNENIIQVWIENPNETYQTGLMACKLAVEVEDKTGICIILR